MLIRSNMLPKNQNAGCSDETPLRTVHQRPPKKMAPSNRPANNDSASNKTSFIGILLFLPDGFVFIRHPVPRIEAADREPGHQQRERPGVLSWIVPVQPHTERCAQ